MILHLALFIQYDRRMDGQMDRRTDGHTKTACAMVA